MSSVSPHRSLSYERTALVPFPHTASGPERVHRRRCGSHSEIRAQAFSAVLGQVVSMRDRERARDGSVNVLSLRTLRVFSDHKQETDSSTKGLVCLPHNQVKDGYEPSLSPALHPLFSFRCTRDCTACAPSALVRIFFSFSDLSCAEQGGVAQKKYF